MKHLASRFLLALGVGCMLGASPATWATVAADWPTYHHDNARTGFDVQQVAFNSVAPDWTSSALDGAAYAQPLVVGSSCVQPVEPPLVARWR